MRRRGAVPALCRAAALLALGGLLAGMAAVAAEPAGAQGAAAKEYELGPLPKAAGEDRPRARPTSSITNGSGDGGTATVPLIGLLAGAALLTGLGIRRAWKARGR